MWVAPKKECDERRKMQMRDPYRDVEKERKRVRKRGGRDRGERKRDGGTRRLFVY